MFFFFLVYLSKSYTGLGDTLASPLKPCSPLSLSLSPHKRQAKSERQGGFNGLQESYLRRRVRERECELCVCVLAVHGQIATVLGNKPQNCVPQHTPHIFSKKKKKKKKGKSSNSIGERTVKKPPQLPLQLINCKGVWGVGEEE